MKFSFNKNNIFYYLLTLCIFLLISYLVIDLIKKPEIKSQSSPINVELVESEFKNLLLNMNIDDEWIKISKTKRKLNDSTGNLFKIRIPSDLPFPILLNELTKKFHKKPVEISSKENIINQKSTLELTYHGSLMLKAIINNDSSIHRKSNQFSFIISNIDKLNLKEIEFLISLPEKFAFFLIPSVNAEVIKSKILEGNKQFFIILDDNIEETKYKLDEDYDKGRLVGSIKNIIGNFSETKGYCIDVNSDLVKSNIYPILLKEFKKRKLTLNNQNQFIDISNIKDGTEVEKIKSLIIKSEHPLIFKIEANQFTNIISTLEIEMLRGNKLVFPDKIISDLSK